MKRFVSMCFLCLGVMATMFVSYFYFAQESLLFRKTDLPDDYVFTYETPFEELYLTPEKGARLNALHFKTAKPKGVILYFHGRGANLADKWGKFSEDFTKRGYDFFIVDYRGFGKSKGPLSEKALCRDAKYCYDYLLERFSEEEIVVYGRSLGTAIATYVASQTSPRMLVLESPFFSILDLTPRQKPYLPRFVIPLLLKYHLRTDKWIVDVRSPIHIIHGTKDDLVPYDDSVRLLQLLKDKLDTKLIPLDEAKHNYIEHHPLYQSTLDEILN